MATIDGIVLLNSLADAPWIILTRVFGNSHATYIGLITSWWINQNINHNTGLESGPTYAYHPRGTGNGGQCDALLCTDNQALGVVEVEGTRIQYTTQKIGKYFGTTTPYLQSLQFAILALYSYKPIGIGERRTFTPIASQVEREEIQLISTQYPAKPIILITIKKEYQRQIGNVRHQSEYYFGETKQIDGFLYQNGEVIATKNYYHSQE